MGWPKGKKRGAPAGAHRAKIGAATKERMADPSVRAKMSAAIKERMADPSVRAKMSAACLKTMHRKCFHCEYANRNALQPLDGIDGEFECKNERLCEQRIQKRMAVVHSIEQFDRRAQRGVA